MAQGTNRDGAGKRDNQMMIISIISLFIVSLFLVEVYEIINDPQNLIAIGIIGAAILASVYVETVFIRRVSEKREREQEEAYNNIYRSEKASYLLMRKYFDQMNQAIKEMGDGSGVPYEEIITAQKALAKVQISKNKEDTRALINLNDKMFKKMMNIQSALENVNVAGLSEEDKSIFNEENKKILQMQQNLLDGLNKMEESLRNEILESANTMASSIQTWQADTQKSPAQGTAEEIPEPKSIQDMQLQPLDIDFQPEIPEAELVQDMPEEIAEPEDMQLQPLDIDFQPEIPEAGLVQDMPEEIAEPDDMQLQPLDIDFQPEIPEAELVQDMPEEIAEPEIIQDTAEGITEPENMQLQPLENIEDIQLQPLNIDESFSINDKPVNDLKIQPVQENSSESDLDKLLMGMIGEPDSLDNSSNLKETADNSTASNIEKENKDILPNTGLFTDDMDVDTLNDPILDRKFDIPDLSDPGHVMNDDEIAALISNTDLLDEPEIKTAMPDLSDPIHIMSPDEIAALIANI